MFNIHTYIYYIYIVLFIYIVFNEDILYYNQVVEMFRKVKFAFYSHLNYCSFPSHTLLLYYIKIK